MTQAFNLSQLANNLNTSGQLDATDGLTGSVPVANGGTGQSSLTANAVLLGNGTSGVQAVAPSTSGNVLVSNGTTWVSQAPSGGGVTSLNGQTGAITSTNIDAIGSYIVSPYATTGSLAITGISTNTTVSGSLLKYNYSSGPGGSAGGITTNATRLDSTTYNGGGTSLSGTWRLLSLETRYSFNAGCCTRMYVWCPSLWVRIS